MHVEKLVGRRLTGTVAGDCLRAPQPDPDAAAIAVESHHREWRFRPDAGPGQWPASQVSCQHVFALTEERLDCIVTRQRRNNTRLCSRPSSRKSRVPRKQSPLKSGHAFVKSRVARLRGLGIEFSSHFVSVSTPCDIIFVDFHHGQESLAAQVKTIDDQIICVTIRQD